jgi:predicted DNA-binding transcriptional regulator YafY
MLQQMEGGGLQSWPGKVCVVQRTQALQPPAIAPEVMTTVYEALFHDRQFLGEYRSRGEKEAREFVVNPLGLIFSDPVIYLVATLWQYPDIRLFALHRFDTARLLMDGCRRPAGFDLDAYLKSGAVEFPVGDGEGKIKLVLRIASEVAHPLRESPLCADQKFGKEQDGFVRVSGTVADTQQLRWWLLGFGDKVEVLEPQALREEFARVARVLGGYYGRSFEAG